MFLDCLTLCRSAASGVPAPRSDRFADRAVNNLPTLFVAPGEQLGLALEPDRGPVRSIVIEHVERPTPN